MFRISGPLFVILFFVSIGWFSFGYVYRQVLPWAIPFTFFWLGFAIHPLFFILALVALPLAVWMALRDRRRTQVIKAVASDV